MVYPTCKGGYNIFFRENLIFLIKSNGSTLKKIKINNVANGTIEDMVYKKSDPRLSTICEIAKHFNVKLDDLVYTDLSKN